MSADDRCDEAGFSFPVGEAVHVESRALDERGKPEGHRSTGIGGVTMTLRYAPLIQGTTFHVYGFANREAESRFVAPVISAHPQSTVVSPDVQATFNVTA